ncbi:hypothetical protein AJ79_09327 [Helicocarpus griseus UAMH5409]|uniref:Uncharacterized protein n=1 Tax=Helicocarpus griseus UAMH5409 TaxID=1447875 RepID=A0A2B7WKL7_9EURO|nr:hypothetical protein AJ79_09327 [Helicocarpus griseus UAMH5409]
MHWPTTWTTTTTRRSNSAENISAPVTTGPRDDDQLVPFSAPKAPMNNMLSTTSDDDDNSYGGIAAEDSQEPVVCGHRLRRFPTRSLLLVMVPPLITAYFIVVSWAYVTETAESNKFGHRNARWVYYSWFVIGVFGLGISRYGLAGVEAAMLQEHFWQANNAMALLMHSGHSWSNFGGWMKCIGISIRQRLNPVKLRLWWLLSFISLMVTIALPISGLSLELFDGYVETSEPALVIGSGPNDIGNRRSDSSFDRSYIRWSSGSASAIRVPGAGLAYTPSHLDRSEYSYLKSVPNSLAQQQDVPEMFLIPQAEYPVSGTAWGLRLGYNCSVVESASEFTVLNKKNSLMYDSTMDYVVLNNEPFDIDDIRVFNSSSENLLSYIEIGTRRNTSYFDGELNKAAFSGNESLQNLDILEYSLWQMHRANYISLPLEEPDFDNAVSHHISGMGSPLIQTETGSYEVNKTFLSVRSKNYPDGSPSYLQEQLNPHRKPRIVDVAPPIGVRCRVASEFGTAKIDADRLSFRDFIRAPPSRHGVSLNYAPHDGPMTGTFGAWTASFARNKDSSSFQSFFRSLFESANLPPKIQNGKTEHKRFLQADELSLAIKRAFAVEALQLMYDGVENFDSAYQHDTLFASRPDKILGPGAVAPHFPAALLCIWSLGCVILGLRYGFLRRWAEILDGYSFLRFGADYAEEIRGRPVLHGCSREFFECKEDLADIPGLIGDCRKSSKVGHISLVNRGNVAMKNKMYY